MLYLIGLGLAYPSDITVRGLQKVQQSKKVYLEHYTSILMNASLEELCEFYGRDEVILADREMVEGGCEEMIQNSLIEDVSFLVVGDVFGATTHTDLILRCKQRNVPFEVIHNASIMNAAGACGLQLYNFGQTISMVFFTESWKPDSWYDKIMENRKIGLHTLVLLDIKVKEQSIENMARGRLIYEPPRYMSIQQCCEQLLEVEETRGEKAYTEDTPCVAISRLGSDKQTFKSGTIKQLCEYDSGEPLHTLVILGRQTHELELDFIMEFADDRENLKEMVIKDQEYFKPAPWVPPQEEDDDDM
ncbi:Diphthine synthase [Hanseniaspora valbyensis NRRL Y-1626]|uniref:diphthine methyl ester synthase n=1 Tax=Hanseniaspora valbyensis NRRL Y-1626 TaxID=766949 RepID=A0A1B7TK71_9ASCO|nr:Diphthine synthase [Hanseniaspora valbyensis NRRL Y-1626]